MTDVVGDAGSSFLASLGGRARRRAEPRTSIAVAGAGCALAVLGVLIIAGDTGSGGDDFNQVPGILLSALVVVAGYVGLALVRRGPIGTAAVVAAALGVPPLMLFVTFDQGGLPPYSTEAVLLVSTVVWLASYAVGPGRGRPFFLGAGLIGVWFSLLQLTEQLFDAPFGDFPFGFSTSSRFEAAGIPIDPRTGATLRDDTGFMEIGPSGLSFDTPDPTAVGGWSLALGLVFLLVSRWLDRRGSHGTATPFVVAALPCFAVGTAALAGDLEQPGTGLLILLIGAGLALHGANVGRRLTTWVGGAAVSIGAAVFLSDLTDDPTVGGVLFLTAGLALVLGAHGLADAAGEPDEMALATAPGAPPVAEPRPSAVTPVPPPDDTQWAAPSPPPPPAPPVPPPPASAGPSDAPPAVPPPAPESPPDDPT